MLEAQGLTKYYGRIRAVRDVSFTIRPGEILGYLGPNGAGKSTTLRAILGLVHPDAGTASVTGMPYAALDDPARIVGAVLETQSFDPVRSGRDHLRVLASASAIDAERADQVLELVDLSAAANRKAGKYSLGMRQRLALAGALLGDPRILILDEPANGLDPFGIRWLRDFLQAFSSRGNAVLVSSHQLGEMQQMADEAIVIHRGRLVAQASVAELTANGEKSLEDAFLDMTSGEETR
jgi:ABC-2 type transport system ATP-binding protein